MSRRNARHGEQESNPSAAYSGTSPFMGGWGGALGQFFGKNVSVALQQNCLRRAEQPPRVQTPVPELKPAKRSIAPAHYFIIL